MSIKISLPEVVSIFKEIQQNPEQIFQMVRRSPIFSEESPTRGGADLLLLVPKLQLR
jgi:hypothetical protein